MGTNIYMFTKNKSIAEKYAPYDYKIVDVPSFGYEFHCCKRSYGWLPLFQGHENGINSVKEYKECYSSGEVAIYDEYGEMLSWENFENDFINWNGGRRGVNPIEKVENPLDDDILYTPVSHIPGYKQSYKGYYKGDTDSIFEDDEGYEFESRDFT